MIRGDGSRRKVIAMERAQGYAGDDLAPVCWRPRTSPPSMRRPAGRLAVCYAGRLARWAPCSWVLRRVRPGRKRCRQTRSPPRHLGKHGAAHCRAATAEWRAARDTDYGPSTSHHIPGGELTLLPVCDLCCGQRLPEAASDRLASPKITPGFQNRAGRDRLISSRSGGREAGVGP